MGAVPLTTPLILFHIPTRLRCMYACMYVCIGQAPTLTGFEADALALVQANLLEPEDKLAIGTIKR